MSLIVAKMDIHKFISEEAFSLEIPDDWDVWECSSDAIFLASAPVDVEPFEPQIVILKEELSPERDATAYLMSNYLLLAAMPGFEQVEAGAIPKGNSEVAWMQHSGEVDGFAVSLMDFYVVVGELAYVVNYKAPRQIYASWHDIFWAVGESIRLN